MEDGTDETDPTAATVLHIKFVAYSVVAYIIVGLGLVGNLLNLVVLTRPNLKAGIYIIYIYISFRTPPPVLPPGPPPMAKKHRVGGKREEQKVWL